MAFNEHLAERVREGFRRRRRTAVEKRMMGGLCYMVEEKMCLGVAGDRLMVRIDPATMDEALRRPGCGPMDFTGRPLKSFVFVAPEAWERRGELDYWMDRALEFNPRAQSSKPKAKRPRRAADGAPGRNYRAQG